MPGVIPDLLGDSLATLAQEKLGPYLEADAKISHAAVEYFSDKTCETCRWRPFQSSDFCLAALASMKINQREKNCHRHSLL